MGEILRKDCTDSTNVDYAEYDEVNELLRVKFRRGKAYEYAGVPLVVWDGLVGALSVGKFLAAHVYGKFSYKD